MVVGLLLWGRSKGVLNLSRNIPKLVQNGCGSIDSIIG